MPQFQKYAGTALTVIGWITFAITVTTTATMTPNAIFGQIPWLVIVIGVLIALLCFGLTRLGGWLHKRGEEAEMAEWRNKAEQDE